MYTASACAQSGRAALGVQGKAVPSAYGVDASQSSTGQLSLNNVASGVKNVQSKAIKPRPAAFGVPVLAFARKHGGGYATFRKRQAGEEENPLTGPVV